MKKKEHTIYILTTKIQNGFDKGALVCITNMLDDMGFYTVKLCNKKGNITSTQIAYALPDDIELYEQQ